MPNGMMRGFSLYLGTVTWVLFIISVMECYYENKRIFHIFFYTHYSRCVHMEQDIWNWKVFPG